MYTFPMMQENLEALSTFTDPLNSCHTTTERIEEGRSLAWYSGIFFYFNSEGRYARENFHDIATNLAIIINAANVNRDPNKKTMWQRGYEGDIGIYVSTFDFSNAGGNRKDHFLIRSPRDYNIGYNWEREVAKVEVFKDQAVPGIKNGDLLVNYAHFIDPHFLPF